MNACVEIMFEERLLDALPPGERYQRISSHGADFLITYQTDAEAARALERLGPRGRPPTIGELIVTLAKALSTAS